MFRVTDRTPQLWMPDTGEIRACRYHADDEAGTSLRLHLAPHGSVFVVFGEAGDAPSADETLAFLEEGEITGPWEVRFANGWGAPASKTFPRLISWTDVEDEGVKYFSGVAAYHNAFDVDASQLAEGKRLFLDLGRARFLAEVYVNGKSCGILWKPPFRVELTEAARPGKNALVVEVANTWSNRLVGDAQSPDGKKFCRTNIDKSLTFQVPWKETPLLDSGLLGPVKLITTGAPRMLSLR